MIEQGLGGGGVVKRTLHNQVLGHSIFCAVAKQMQRFARCSAQRGLGGQSSIRCTIIVLYRGITVSKTHAHSSLAVTSTSDQSSDITTN